VRQRDMACRTADNANMNLAQRAWDEGHISRVMNLLESGRPKLGETDLRNFEWFDLNRLCYSDLRTLRSRSKITFTN
jgi:hypothetical protein